MLELEKCAEEVNGSSDAYVLIDIRDEASVNYGILPGAIPIPLSKLDEALPEYKERKIVFYCTKGVESVEVAKTYREKGYDCYSLRGGYASWLLMDVQRSDENDRTREIEQSIRKKFHKALFSKFAKAINEYELLQAGDKVAVCISGGKDSMLMAKLFQELKKHNKFQFELEFLAMDPGYSPENRKIMEENARIMNIPLTIFETDIFDAVVNIEKSPCYLCARMRRGHLYNKAKELGCNKIALGHHYDDVIETILMGMLYGAQVQTMMPKLHSQNFEGMELIRPMYLIREEDIIKFRDYNQLHFLQCACRFTETCSTCVEEGTNPSKRQEVKQMIAQMKKVNPFVESNVFRSVQNVNVDTVIAYKQQGVRHSFLDTYDQ